MKGVVLAAGRGSRMGEMTSDQPKCLIEIESTPLLAWQMAAMESAGLELVIVTGYKASAFDHIGLSTVKNEKWRETNMVASLLCAHELLDDDLIVSYADIIYSPSAVKILQNQEHDICILYDKNWENLWSARFDDPLEDAESFSIDPNEDLILDIGRKNVSKSEIDGQYMGLMSFSRKGLGWIKEIVDGMSEGAGQMDMTTLLRALIGRGFPVHGQVFDDAWAEVDSPRDFAVASMLVRDGSIPLPKRGA
jgi:choline kinase